MEVALLISSFPDGIRIMITIPSIGKNVIQVRGPAPNISDINPPDQIYLFNNLISLYQA